jgi:hypothetical protein
MIYPVTVKQKQSKQKKLLKVMEEGQQILSRKVLTQNFRHQSFESHFFPIHIPIDKD